MIPDDLRHFRRDAFDIWPIEFKLVALGVIFALCLLLDRLGVWK